MEPEVWKLEGPVLGVSALVQAVVGYLQSWLGLFWIWELTPGSNGFVPQLGAPPWSGCLSPVEEIEMGWGRG